MKMLVPAVDASAAVRLRVARKTPVADGVLTLTLEHPEGRRLPSWSPGAHLDLVLDNGMTRQFSLCGDRFDAFQYRVGAPRTQRDHSVPRVTRGNRCLITTTT